jgi:hypothetical protein
MESYIHSRKMAHCSIQQGAFIPCVRKRRERMWKDEAKIIDINRE